MAQRVRGGCSPGDTPQSAERLLRRVRIKSCSRSTMTSGKLQWTHRLPIFKGYLLRSWCCLRTARFLDNAQDGVRGRGLDLVLSHCDVQENNILQTQYGLRFIDFESPRWTRDAKREGIGAAGFNSFRVR